MPPRIDITGKVFGHLTALKRLRVNKHGQYIWLCECDCGNKSEVVVSHLTQEHTKSCGCRQGKFISGNEHLRTRRVWSGIQDRSRRITGYADRGIHVCDRWRKFENFLSDMGEAPPGLTIERIDNDKGYNPNNCKWASMSEQNRNKRNNHRVEYKGKSYVLTDLANEHGAEGVYASLMSIRMKRGWSLQRALMTPVQKCGF